MGVAMIDDHVAGIPDGSDGDAIAIEFGWVLSFGIFWPKFLAV